MKIYKSMFRVEHRVGEVIQHQKSQTVIPCFVIINFLVGLVTFWVSLRTIWTAWETLKFKYVGCEVPVCLVFARVYICLHARVRMGILPKVERPLVVNPVNGPTKRSLRQRAKPKRKPPSFHFLPDFYQKTMTEKRRDIFALMMST